MRFNKILLIISIGLFNLQLNSMNTEAELAQNAIAESKKEAEDTLSSNTVIDAIKKGDKNFAIALIQNGADTEETDNLGYTPLMWALEKGWPDVADLIHNIDGGSLESTEERAAKAKAASTAILASRGSEKSKKYKMARINCPDCGKEVSSHALVRHRKTHTDERNHKCLDCKKSFLRKEYLDIHKVVHTDEQPFQCNDCGIKFRQKHNLKIHRKKSCKVLKEKESGDVRVKPY